MYASALGENAIERYALFLVSLALTADINERRLALTRARDHGLDPARVAVVTAERTIEQAFDVGQPLIVLQHFEPRLYVQVLPILEGPLPSIIALQPPPTDAEFFLLRSIEWTIFQHTTYNTALEQANVILRYFLGKFL